MLNATDQAVTMGDLYEPRWPPDQDGLQTKMAPRPRWLPDQDGLQTKMASRPRWPPDQDVYKPRFLRQIWQNRVYPKIDPGLIACLLNRMNNLTCLIMCYIDNRVGCVIHLMR